MKAPHLRTGTGIPGRRGQSVVRHKSTIDDASTIARAGRRRSGVVFLLWVSSRATERREADKEEADKDTQDDGG